MDAPTEQGLFTTATDPLSGRTRIAANSSVPFAERKRIVGQTRQVLDILKRNGSINPELARTLNIHRLAARIGELRAAGYTIETSREEGREAVYFMEAVK